MGKNNRLINSLNEIARRNRQQNVEKASDEMVPQIYAALAIALHREFGWGYTRINRAFVESQKIWEDFSGSGPEMIELCEKETGIKVINKEQKDYD
jgi:hypothetical protein